MYMAVFLVKIANLLRNQLPKEPFWALLQFGFKNLKTALS